ncbi:hypothetical protein MKZ38_008474 [Zalerion maritima]|uniref:Transcription factor hoxa13 n=1 Tax=Zalerion maritima TaxID=339359 RepID=A0AAD5RUZ6_9PEZI|nr:hypothetical protein MKZ38_008474 [Zalerion maritima]
MENGKASKGLNGHAVTVRRDSPQSPTAQKPSMSRRLFSSLARILAWIAILNVLLRCPSSLEQCDGTSPLFCKQYFQAKQTVTPIVKPYYDTHAAPYVNLAKPYYDAVDRTVITPSKGYAAKYVAPSIEQGSVYVHQQWDKNLAPEITKARTVISEKYDDKVAPHVGAIGNAASPYVEIARTNALQTYHEFLLPAYLFAQPYAVQGYNTASDFATNTLVPTTIWAINKTYVFLDDTMLPQLRLLYAEAVEPQLVRIGQRLGRYNGSKPKGQGLENVSAAGTTGYSSFTKPASSAAPASANTATESVTSVPTTDSTFMPSASVSADESATGQELEEATPTRELLVQPPPIEDKENDRRRTTRIEITNDMISWQEKFMDAAETGATEIADNVVDICGRMESQEVEITGKQAVGRFVDSLQEEMSGLRLEIVNIVETVPDKEEAMEQVTTAVRRVGLTLKERAQNIRAWREKFERDLHTAINRAAHAHFELLDNIKDLALQKMGMKWAWMDGVTYKDWKLYHAMKAEFINWRTELEKSVVTHKSLEKTTNAAADVEDLGMVYAKDAALELKSLKEVGHWKVIAGDSSNNFDPQQMREAAESMEAPVGTDNTLWDDKATVVEEEETFGSQVEPDDGSMVMDDYPAEQGDEPPSARISEVKESVKSAASYISSAAKGVSSVGVDMNSGLPTIVANESEASESPEHPVAVGEPESVEVGEPELPLESVIAEASADASEVELEVEPEVESSEVASEAEESQEVVDEEDEEDEQEDTGVPVSESTPPVKPAMFGAAAQVVPRRQPVLDGEDEGDMGAQVNSMASAAYSTASSLASMQYSMAMSVVSAQYGTSSPKPVHEAMLASVSSAYSNAMETASSRLDDALEAASAQMIAAPTANPVTEKWSSIEAIASSRLVEGRAWAAAQYQSAKIAAGIATPTPTSNVDKAMEHAKYHYYAGLGLAQARYEEFVAAASSAVSSLTATPTPTNLKGTASSVASEATESAASIASVASENASSSISAASSNASSVAAAASDKVGSAMSAAGESVSAATDAVAKSFDETISMLSVQVYGQPTPAMWYEPALSSASSVASDASYAASSAATDATEAAQVKWDEVSALVSELVVGKEPSFTESVFDRLSGAYGQAVSTVGAIVSEAGSVMSEATESVVSAVSEATEAAKSVKDEL